MKKIFLAKRNALISSTDVSWGLYALFGALLVLFFRLLAPNLFWHAASPIFRVADLLAAESHMLLGSFNGTIKLVQENERLTNENVALMNENRMLLQKTIAIDALASQGIKAGIVARPPESPYDILTLAGGTKIGITSGMEAFGPGGVPLGIVTAVFADFSRVTLFSSPGMVTHGWIGHAALPLTIFGEGAGTFKASLSRSANIMVGDAVFVPGPGQLLIGNVARIDGDPSSPSVTLRIMPALNLFSLAWVVVRNTGIGAFVSATSTLP